MRFALVTGKPEVRSDSNWVLFGTVGQISLYKMEGGTSRNKTREGGEKLSSYNTSRTRMNSRSVVKSIGVCGRYEMIAFEIVPWHSGGLQLSAFLQSNHTDDPHWIGSQSPFPTVRLSSDGGWLPE